MGPATTHKSVLLFSMVEGNMLFDNETFMVTL